MVEYIFLWDLRERFTTLTTGCQAKLYSDSYSFGPENEGVHRNVLDFKGQKESVLQTAPPSESLFILQDFWIISIFVDFLKSLWAFSYLPHLSLLSPLPISTHCCIPWQVFAFVFSWEADCIVDKFLYPKFPPKFFLLAYFS